MAGFPGAAQTQASASAASGLTGFWEEELPFGDCDDDDALDAPDHDAAPPTAAVDVSVTDVDNVLSSILHQNEVTQQVAQSVAALKTVHASDMLGLADALAQLYSARYHVFVRETAACPSKALSVTRLHHMSIVLRPFSIFHSLRAPSWGDLVDPSIIVEPAFKDNLGIPYPSPRYQAIYERLPEVFVAPAAQFTAALARLADEMAASFASQSRSLPPWRTLQGLASMWDPSLARDTPIHTPTCPKITASDLQSLCPVDLAAPPAAVIPPPPHPSPIPAPRTSHALQPPLPAPTPDPLQPPVTNCFAPATPGTPIRAPTTLPIPIPRPLRRCTPPTVPVPAPPALARPHSPQEQPPPWPPTPGATLAEQLIQPAAPPAAPPPPPALGLPTQHTLPSAPPSDPRTCQAPLPANPTPTSSPSPSPPTTHPRHPAPPPTAVRPIQPPATAFPAGTAMWPAGAPPAVPAPGLCTTTTTTRITTTTTTTTTKLARKGTRTTKTTTTTTTTTLTEHPGLTTAVAAGAGEGPLAVPQAGPPRATGRVTHRFSPSAAAPRPATTTGKAAAAAASSTAAPGSTTASCTATAAHDTAPGSGLGAPTTVEQALAAAGVRPPKRPSLRSLAGTAWPRPPADGTVRQVPAAAAAPGARRLSSLCSPAGLHRAPESKAAAGQADGDSGAAASARSVAQAVPRPLGLLAMAVASAVAGTAAGGKGTWKGAGACHRPALPAAAAAPQQLAPNGAAAAPAGPRLVPSMASAASSVRQAGPRMVKAP